MQVGLKSLELVELNEARSDFKVLNLYKHQMIQHEHITSPLCTTKSHEDRR